MITQEYMAFARQTIKELDCRMTIDLIEWTGNTDSHVSLMMNDLSLTIVSDDQLDEIIESLRVIAKHNWS